MLCFDTRAAVDQALGHAGGLMVFVEGATDDDIVTTDAIAANVVDAVAALY